MLKIHVFALTEDELGDFVFDVTCRTVRPLLSSSADIEFCFLPIDSCLFFLSSFDNDSS